MVVTELDTVGLAELTSRIMAMTPAAGPADRIERIGQFEVLIAALAAAQLREATELLADRVAEDAARGVPVARRGRGVAGELGLARHISPNQAARWLSAAQTLRADLPVVFAQLSLGRTSVRRALAVAREAEFLSPDDRRVVDAEVGPRMPGLGDRAVEDETRRVAQRLDPLGAAQRARNAVNDRRVTVRPAPDVMSRLGVLVPVEQGVAAYAARRKHADALIAVGAQGINADGAPRTRDQVMADTAVERLTGITVSGDVPVEIHLVMTDRTLLHNGAEPGLVLGHGPVPAPTARDLALRHRMDTPGNAGGAADEARRWIRRLYLSPDRSQLVAMDSSRRAFTENQRLFIRIRDEDTCRTPWCDAPVRHIDHVRDHARGGRTSVDNAQGYCVACNHTKQAAGWRTEAARDGTITTITPTGHRYTGRRPAPPGTSRGTKIKYWRPGDRLVLVEQCRPTAPARHAARSRASSAAPHPAAAG